MSRQFRVRIRGATWQVLLAFFAFVQVVATFTALIDRLYVVKWLAGVGILSCFFVLGRCKVSTALLREFSLVVMILTIGFLSQLGETLDTRAVAIAASYTLTASATFLIAPCAFRRRSVQRLVWPAMLLGVTVGTMLGEYLGVLDPLASILSDEGRWRFLGAFYQANAAGTAGLIGLILAGASFIAARRWFYLAALPPLALVMALADSRGSILAAVAFVTVLAMAMVARLPLRRVAILTSLGALVLLGFGLFHSASLEWPDTSHAPTALNQFSSGRLANWTKSLSYLDGPLRWTFGLGLSKNFSFIPYETAFKVAVRGSSADNFYVDLVGRAGVVGLVLFLGAVGSLTSRIWRGFREASPGMATERALGLAVLAATLVLGATNSAILTWGWLHAMVAWPLAAGTAARPVYRFERTRPVTAG